MKKYILKDISLYNWLCEKIEDFDDIFQEECSKALKDETNTIYLKLAINRSLGIYIIISLEIKKYSIAEIDENYDSTAWNDYPIINPPKNIEMQVETIDGKRFCGIYAKDEKGMFWHDANSGDRIYGVNCFRSWE